MGFKIEDATGKGYGVKVNSNNRMETLSITESRIADISNKDGNSFLLTTGFISLTTTGSFNGILYMKNNSDKKLFISKIRTCSDATTTVQHKLIANPTTGTLISDANAANQIPANVGASTTFDGLAYSASGNGKTVTDGTDMSNFINRSPGHSIQDYEGALIIPKGSSLALVAKPGSATTYCSEVQCWFE